MTDSKKHEVKIKHKAFAYTIDREGGLVQEMIAYRGQTVEVNDLDFKRGQRHGAFYTDADEKTEGSGAPGAEATLDDLVNWIETDKPTVQDVVDASGGDLVKAKLLLDAENAATGNDPRKGVVEGLTAVIQQDNS
jgi:hypothetical protein